MDSGENSEEDVEEGVETGRSIEVRDEGTAVVTKLKPSHKLDPEAVEFGPGYSDHKIKDKGTFQDDQFGKRKRLNGLAMCLNWGIAEPLVEGRKLPFVTRGSVGTTFVKRGNYVARG